MKTTATVIKKDQHYMLTAGEVSVFFHSLLACARYAKMQRMEIIHNL